MVLDSLIVTGSFALISWLTVLRPIWQNRTGNKLELVVSLGYPLGDVLVMTLGLLVLIRAAPGMRLTLSLLVAGLMAAALADSLWVYQSNTSGYSTGGLVDLLYFANSLLIIVALVAGYRAVPDVSAGEPPGWLSRSLPLVPLAAAAVVVATTQPDVNSESPVVIGGAVLIVSLLLRQLLEAVELGKRERQVRELADRLSGELASASKYVSAILAGDLDGPVRIRSRYLPSSEIGGDTYGYLWIDEDHLVVYVIDVSGHGVEPALLSISVHNMLRARSMPTATLLSPPRLMTELNALFRMEGHGDHYFTIWYGVYEVSTRTMHYVTAGHPPALALTDDGGTITATPLSGTSIPIGMFPESVFTSGTYRVPAGAQLLLCSDGVLGNRMSFADFTELCEEVAASPNWTPTSLIGRLRATTDGTFDDDCALVQLTF